MIKYSCGCVNDYLDGVMHSEFKCDGHRRLANSGREDDKGREYYEKLGVLSGETKHVEELTGALGLHALSLKKRVLEVGCGVSPYAEWLVADRGCEYYGIDPCGWAVEEMRRRGFQAEKLGLEEMAPSAHEQYDMVLAAHVLEHVYDARAALSAMRYLLTPGGKVIIVVPDDSDPVNPDHLWFFTPETIKTLASQFFEEVRVESRRIVQHENFLYLFGRKANG